MPTVIPSQLVSRPFFELIYPSHPHRHREPRSGVAIQESQMKALGCDSWIASLRSQ